MVAAFTGSENVYEAGLNVFTGRRHKKRASTGIRMAIG